MSHEDQRRASEEHRRVSFDNAISEPNARLRRRLTQPDLKVVTPADAEEAEPVTLEMLSNEGSPAPSRSTVASPQPAPEAPPGIAVREPTFRRPPAAAATEGGLQPPDPDSSWGRGPNYLGNPYSPGARSPNTPGRRFFPLSPSGASRSGHRCCARGGWSNEPPPPPSRAQGKAGG